MPTVSTFEGIISGSTWNGDGAAGRPAFVTYSFETTAADYLSDAFSPEFLASFQAFSAAEQATARQALQAWADASGLVFIEVPAGQGDIRFGQFDFAKGPEDIHELAGYAYYPMVGLTSIYGTADPLGGDIFIRPGFADFFVLAHEIGHALGLKHPFEDDPILDKALDDTTHTIMSYTAVGSAPTALGPLDREAIAHLYGPNSADGTQAASWSWSAAANTLTQTGGVGNETIVGVSVTDLIAGGGGADRIYGGGGGDRLDGEDGADSISGGTGNDTLNGGSGDDALESGGGLDVLNGGAGDDALIRVDGPVIADGGEGDDILFMVGPSAADGSIKFADLTVGGGSFTNIEQIGYVGYEGGDTIIGGWMVDFAYGGEGADSISTAANDDYLAGEEGADTLMAGDGDDLIEGGDGNDFLRGEAGNDEIWGGPGFDDTHGNAGDDTIYGGAGPDWVVGGQGNDLLYAGEDSWDNVVYGNLGNDTCHGGDGIDWVRGGQGDDVLYGGAGADFVAGDRGNDTLTGGAGADLFHAFAEAGLDRILDFSAAQGDRLNLLAGTTYTLAQSGADVVVSMTGGGQVVLVGVQLSALPDGWLYVG